MTRELPEDVQLSRINYTFRMTKEDREFLAMLGQLVGSESNALRRGLKLLAKAEGIEVPDGVLVDREAGNRLPKPKGKETALALAS